MKMKRIYPPKEWNMQHIMGSVAMEIATLRLKRRPKMKFDAFHREMVNAFGACGYDSALYLWSKLRPGKPPKFIIMPEVFQVGDKVKLSKWAVDACLSDLYANRAEGDITTAQFNREDSWIRAGKPIEICGIEPGGFLIGANGKPFEGTGLIESDDLTKVN